MYLGLFVTIHQDTSGDTKSVTIHVSWMRHDDTSGYIPDTSRYMYLGCFVRAALATHKIRSRCNTDTFKIRIQVSSGLVLFALLPKELKAIRLFVTRVGRHVWSTLKGRQQLSTSPLPSLLQRIRLNRLELKAHVEPRQHVVDVQHVGADAHLLESLARLASKSTWIPLAWQHRLALCRRAHDMQHIAHR